MLMCEIDQVALPVKSIAQPFETGVMTMSHVSLEKSDSLLYTGCLPDGVIHWSEAREHIGELVTIYGEVASTFFDWDEYERWVGYPEARVEPPATFMEIGARHPNKKLLKVVIPGEHWSKFERPPSEQFENTVVILKGTPYIHEGIVHIRITSPRDIVETSPIPELYVSPDYKWLSELGREVRPVFYADRRLRLRLSRYRDEADDWEDPELYDNRVVVTDEWGEEVDAWTIDAPGVHVQMYFDEDNGWMVN